MFTRKKTKIVSSPTEEVVLEVLPEEPQLQQVVAMDFVTVQGNVKYIYYGTVTDYDGQEYEFEWDDQSKRLCRLIGSRVTDLMWAQTSRILEQEFKIAGTEETIQSLLTRNNETIVRSLTSGIKEIDSKVEKLINTRPPVVSRVIDSQPALPPQPKPVLQIQAPVEEEFEEGQLVSPEDDEIAQRALQYLQGAEEDNLGIDYLSL